MSDYYKALLERAETDLNCRFISEDFVLGCSITAELIKDLTETMVALEAIRVSKDKRIAELEADNKAALDRLYDMYLGDDGQAWKEARKFLLAKGYIGEDDKPIQQPDSGGE